MPKSRSRMLAGLALLLGGIILSAGPSRPASPSGLLLPVSGAIGPATTDYVKRGLALAQRRGAELVILQIDTPGGLDSAMRDIIQHILQSPVPVIGFVAPQGARAASAGTYILYACHVAAMAPATNLGAATPVSIGVASPFGGSQPESGQGGDANAPQGGGEAGAPPPPAGAEARKTLNDAVAYIRSLAERRGRNAEWAEQAVRSAASLTARQALDKNVIDIVAANVDGLLSALDGYRVEVQGETRTLSTAGLTLERLEPDWRTELLQIITNPTVAYLLMLIGIYGLIFEGYSPGAIVPGVVGAICLLLALFAFQILPINYAGLALIVLGVLLIVAETLVPSFGALGIGGIAAFVFGSVILVDSDVPGFGISLRLIGSMATAGALILMGIVLMAVRIRYRPVVSGREELFGALAVALTDFDGTGTVRVHGERWRAHSGNPVKAGQRLRVTGVQGLQLEVAAESPETGPAQGETT